MTPDTLFDSAPLVAQLRAAPGLDRLMALIGDANLPDLIEPILEESARFAQQILAPLNSTLDRLGCRLEDGRVRTAPGHAEAWRAFCDAGWQTLDKPVDCGGQGLPLVVWAACQELFDRGCVAFGMLPSSQGAAVRLLEAHADDSLKAEWLGPLSTGAWAASICISEPDAGSDVGRARTLATPLGDGAWAITGEKIWITFGDHDLAPRIGHCLLARTPGAAPGGGGLSLFLAPSTLADGARNAIQVRRIEEKMGLHGSPTCALGFEGARATLLGQEGKGLSQLFAMLTIMRLSVGVQGLGLASGAVQTARAYAAERRQGGPAAQPPVALDTHADIQRLLMQGLSRVETLRGLVYANAVQADLAQMETDPAAKADAGAFSQWLLSIVKTLGGEAAFDTASEAIQVLGGSGYVRDWPVEQALRDSRVFTIYEGATGMQALDMLHRRLWRDGGAGQAVFLRRARADVAAQAASPQGAALIRVLDLLESASSQLTAWRDTPRQAEAGATAYLELAGLAATGWIALRLSAHPQAQLAQAGRYWLSDLHARAAVLHSKIMSGAAPLDGFAAFQTP